MSARNSLNLMVFEGADWWWGAGIKRNGILDLWRIITEGLAASRWLYFQSAASGFSPVPHNSVWSGD